jgi:YkoY family integral membrane protein
VELSLIIEYSWVLLILIGLEGLLAADNALVMAIMVKHLPTDKRKKALFYGLLGAFVFRFTSLFVISFLVDIWQVQAIGALYLLFICVNNLYKKYLCNKEDDQEECKVGRGSGFWMTVLKVELADIAFAVDSILAAVALAVTLPPTSLPQIGGLDGGQFLVIFTGGFIGLVIIRFAANLFVGLLHSRPGLETAAFLIVGWVGVKLTIITLCHPEVGILPYDFAHSTVLGWFSSKKRDIQVA